MIKDHYLKFLGVTNNHESIFSSMERTLPLNSHYFYEIITTTLEDKRIYSVAPVHVDSFRIFSGAHPKLRGETLLRAFNLEKKLNYNIRKLYRMSYHGQALEHNSAEVVTEKMLLQTLKNENKKTIEKCLARNREALKNKCKFRVTVDKEFAAQALVTDIYHGGGNIAVYTNPKHRGKGYGKMVVDRCVDWCLKRDIEPIYLVDHDNQASINLANSLGFRTFSTEWIMSTERGLE